MLVIPRLYRATRRRWSAIQFLLLFAVVQPHTLLANEVTWTLRPTRSYVPQSSSTFAIFGPADTIDIQITIVNDVESRSLAVLEPRFFDNVKIVIARQPENQILSLASNLREVAECGGADAVPACSTDSTLYLRPGGWVTVSVTLTGVTAAPGDYRISADLSAARVYLLADNGGPWEGKFAAVGSVPLAVRAIRTADDRRRNQMIEAGEAMVRKDYQTALGAFEAMAMEDPSSAEAHAGIGLALVQLGRLSEAAAALEQSLARSANTDSSVPAQLAAVYIAMAQDARAEATLRRVYGQAAVPEGLARAREMAKRISKR